MSPPSTPRTILHPYPHPTHRLLPTSSATERMDQLYVSTLAALSAGQADPAAGALALASDPGAYQQQLAEAVTGVPVVREGYDTAYDMLLQVRLHAGLETVEDASRPVRLWCWLCLWC